MERCNGFPVELHPERINEEDRPMFLPIAMKALLLEIFIRLGPARSRCRKLYRKKSVRSFSNSPAFLRLFSMKTYLLNRGST